MPGERLLDIDSTFFLGCDSSLDPNQTRLGGYWHGINCVNVGGQVSCRPGYKCIVQLPQGKLQGATLFRPALGFEQMIVAVDGAIYVAEYPFKNFRLLTNVQFLPYAKQIFWQQAVQSAERRTADQNSAIDVIEPRQVLFMQDGFTAPAFYDGSSSGHIRDEQFETPIGTAMAFAGDRLWVARGDKVFASDISNPFSFREQTYPGGVSAFEFAGDVTAMINIPSLEFPQLLVFTESDVSLLQANIRDRSLWPTTDNFQKQIANVGCPSQRSLVSHFGTLSWMSPSGVAIFDASVLGRLSSRLPIKDNELLVSKTQLFDDLSTVAGAAFGQFLLFSTPAHDLYNKHTWALNNASLETLADASGPSWMGIWLGTRPVEWVYGSIAGKERAYHVSFDEDEQNRLWETFRPERLDNGCPITWGFFTRAYFGATGGSGKTPGMNCRFKFADVSLVGIEEDLDIGIFYAGGLRGAFKPVCAKRISVERGSLSYDQEITATTQLFAFKPQVRIVRSEDANQQAVDLETGSCPPESDKLEDVDSEFQLAIIFHGPAAVRQIRTFGILDAEDYNGGAPEVCENQARFNAVRFDGVGVTSTDYAGAVTALSEAFVRRFTANRTTAVSQDGFTAIGVGFAESVVSQDAADRVAEIVAVKQAEAELSGVVPPILSVGLGFNA
jgi:hypothetical protein